MIWSFALGIVSLVVLWAIGHGKTWGWLLGFCNQILWATYSIVTKQYGFLMLCFCFSFLYLNNYWKAKRVVTNSNSTPVAD